MRTLPAVLTELKKELEAEIAHVEVNFPYVIEKAAPVSGEKGLMDYDCSFTSRVEWWNRRLHSWRLSPYDQPLSLQQSN